MSIARHHADWLSLVESSGPFLSMPVLLRVFPQGLDPRDAAKASKLREAYEDWLERGAKQPAVHHAWIRHILTELLEYPPEFLAEGQAIPPGIEAVMANFGETLRADFVLKHRDVDKKPLLLIEHYAPDQDLEKPVVGKTWKASPGTRMMELLHAADVPLGLITNGEQWMIVSAARGETTGFASWYADLWMQEPITLRAFHSLLHLRRFLGVAEPETLAALYAESSKDQQEVTDQLGYQVRQAVEMLVQAFDRIDAESGRKLLADVSEKTLYDSALTVMMRLVFLFSADERGLLLLGDPLYDQHYAVSTLSEILRERADQHGEEVLERRHDAWCRLLATFRAVHAGVQHEAMRLPPYGGTLFDPDRYPFLEGRTAETKWQTTSAKPLPINNRVVLHLLEALQVLRVKVPGGGPAEARRLSFRALDIEQIGHVYEGLLDHTAKRANEVILGLAGNRNAEPEIPLSKLEEIETKGRDPLIEFLKKETGRSTTNPIRKALEKPEIVDDHALLIACAQDPLLEKRVRPFAALLRDDSFGQLVVIPKGSVYVTVGTDRRSTGTHYTPRILTEPIVQHTLEPLVYLGPAEGLPQHEWKLKSAREILALKVCDMTMGSGAFLVQTCRYLAERLVEAWEQAEKSQPGKFIKTPEGDLATGDPSERLLPADPAERLAIARRYVADRCLYGVDINPMAVEMAKLSLWLITLQHDRPFTFLDHALKCGDSLLGVSTVKQIENFSLRAGERQVTFATANLFRYVEEASAKRRALEDLPSNNHGQIETKNRLHLEAEAATAKVKALADALIAFELRGLDGEDYEEQRTNEAEKVQSLMKRDADASLNSQTPVISKLSAYAREQLRERRTFHWPVEFPEVFAGGGFDSFASNPPFVGNKYWLERLPAGFSTWVQILLGKKAGKADVVAVFLRRAFDLVAQRGTAGIIATSTAREGDTLELGFAHVSEHGEIYRAVSAREWPGDAGVHVCIVWFSKHTTLLAANLDGKPVTAIGPSLVEATPHDEIFELASAPWGFIGCDNGGGEILTVKRGNQWLERLETAQSPFLRGYISGEDIAEGRHLNPERWVVDCGDLPLATVEERCAVTSDFLRNFVMVGRSPEDFETHPGLIDRWWQMWNPRASQYRKLRQCSSCLAIPVVAKFVSVVELPTAFTFTNKICVLEKPAPEQHVVLLSSFFEAWVIKQGGTMGATRITLALKKCIRTFPYPLAHPAEPKTLISEWNQALQNCAGELGNGYTPIFNEFHSNGNESVAIKNLRAVKMRIDQAVVAAYSLLDLNLGHGFHETKQGVRFTISESARRAVLSCLLKLNHQRYEEEIKTRLLGKGRQKAKQPKRETAKVQPTERLLPSGFRFAVSDPAIYGVNLIVALLSEAGGTLPWEHLRDGFVFATRSDLMKKYAPAEDAERVEAWARRWNETAGPKLLPACLKALGRKNIFIQASGSDFTFQLADGPKPAASEDVAYDAWLALRMSMHLNGKPVPLPESEVWLDEVRQLLAA